MTSTDRLEPADEAPPEPIPRRRSPLRKLRRSPPRAGRSDGESPDAAASPAAPPAATTEPAATELIEVWRPGRRDEHHPRKPRPERAPRQRRPQRRIDAPPVAAAAVHRRRRPAPTMRPRPWRTLPRLRRRPRRARTAKLPIAAGTGVAPNGRAPRSFAAPGTPRAPSSCGTPGARRRAQRGDRPDRPPRGDRPDHDPDLRAKYIKGRAEGRDRRDREPDPNSPFAKLAALKEQLEANTKEPR